MSKQQTVKATVLDAFAIAKLCCDAARPRAMLENSGATWESDTSVEDDWLFSTAYKVMPWKEPPGSVQINTDMKKVGERTLSLAQKYNSTFYDKLGRSPVEASKYADSLVKMAADAKDLYLQFLKENNKINKDIEDYWTQHVIVLKSAKLAGGIAANFTPGAFALVHGFASFGIDLVQATTVTDAGIIIGKKAVEEGAEQVGLKAAEPFFKNANVAWKLAQEGNVRMEHLEKALINKKSQRKIIKITRQLHRAETKVATKLAETSANLTKSKVARLAPKAGLTLLFAAFDVADIWEEYTSLNSRPF